MRKSLVVSLIVAGVVSAVALPTLAERAFDPSIVSAEKVTSINATKDGTWALTSSGKVLFCKVVNEQAPKVVCFDRAGRTGMDY